MVSLASQSTGDVAKADADAVTDSLFRVFHCH